jgi:hypothetical protein
MFTKTLITACALCAFASAGHAQTMNHTNMDHAAHMAEMARQAQAQREAAVAERGKDVMPFSLAATTHVFTKDARGGVQRVVARNAADSAQVVLVRQHLQTIRGQFLKGDFSGPSHIHGQDMPGLAQLEAARPGQVAIGYQEVPGGAELRYAGSDPGLVAALHQWFDAQLADHGKDAMAGHAHHGGGMKP